MISHRQGQAQQSGRPRSRTAQDSMPYQFPRSPHPVRGSQHSCAVLRTICAKSMSGTVQAILPRIASSHFKARTPAQAHIILSASQIRCIKWQCSINPNHDLADHTLHTEAGHQYSRDSSCTTNAKCKSQAGRIFCSTST